MAISRVIEVSFGRSSVALVRIDTAYFYNSGIIFKPTDINLPASYQVHWADSPQATSTLETIGTAEGAPIPDDLWNRSRVIYGWIYLHPTEDSGITYKEVRIYKNVRAGKPDGTEPTPAEQSTIDQLIGALNSAVVQTGEDVESASQSAQSAESAKTVAESARDTAQTYANNAQTSATSAQTSASQASASASASAQSASASVQIKSDIEGMVESARGYANASATNAASASRSADQAESAATNAATFATNAGNKAVEAAQSANTASTKASEASTSAQTASTKASEAAQSASQALSYKTDAESAKVASQTAQGLAESARDSAVSAKTGAESARDDAESARDEAQQAVASIADALAEKAPVITDTASGAIASFSDGADDLPLKSLVVDINPVQDLHGQDSPYPAGGGKNLIDFTGPQTITAQTELARISTSEKTTFTLSATIVSDASVTSALNIYLYNKNSYVAYKQVAIPANAPSARYSVSMDTSEYTFNQIRAIITGSSAGYSLTVSNVQLEKSAAATAWSPYENICPISGWTQVGVEQSGVNLFDGTFVNMAIAAPASGAILRENASYRGLYVRVKSGQTYTVSRTTIETNRFRIGATVDEPAPDVSVNELSNIVANDSEYSVTVTIPDGYNYLFVYLSNQSDTCTANNYQVQLGSTATPYEPYTGRSITINLGQTVYGGHLDVLSGELTVYPYYASYNGETLTGEWISDRDKYVSETTPTIGAQVVNIGAQGVTVQLEPHEVESLYGVNNLWADSGDTSAEYRADTKLYIERLTAPDSADMIADANITSGKYFMVGNSLYKATANIANGSAIIVGTNAVRKSLSEALNEINA